MPDPWFLFQAFVSLCLVAVFAVMAYRQRGDQVDVVTLTGLAVIALANVATAIATAHGPALDTLRDFGGTLARATLVVVAVYLVALFRRRER